MSSVMTLLYPGDRAERAGKENGIREVIRGRGLTNVETSRLGSCETGIRAVPADSDEIPLDRSIPIESVPTGTRARIVSRR